MKDLEYKRRMQRKRYKHKRRIRISGIMIIVVILALAVVGIIHFAVEKNEAAGEPEQLGKLQTSSIETDQINLYSPNAVLWDLTGNTILAEYRSREKIYPASLTKIMTAILAIENTDDLEKKMIMPSDIFWKLYIEGASMAGFQPKEEVQLRDLLYGMLLPSGAECCLAFADEIAGSEKAFVKLMNQKALELGMNDTHFCNATGLHEEDHYSTVKDIAVLLQYALLNEEFRAAFTSSSYSTQSTEQHPGGFTLHSTMFEDLDSPEVPGGEILGGKTGYTDEAGLCLASLAKVGEKEYILVTAKADVTHDTKPLHILDAVSVYGRIK